MYDLITAVINELDQELVRRRCEATQLKLEQAALTDCEDVATGWWKVACLDRTNRGVLVYEDWCDCCQARWQDASSHWTSLDAGFR